MDWDDREAKVTKPPGIGTDKLGRDIFDYAHGVWMGVPRSEIHWGPAVGHDRCVGCGLCHLTCGGRIVYDWCTVEARPTVPRYDNCSPGCNTCANLCPADAITFPALAEIRAQQDQNHIVGKARKRLSGLRSRSHPTEDSAGVQLAVERHC